jgi:hypothetical protein
MGARFDAQPHRRRQHASIVLVDLGGDAGVVERFIARQLHQHRKVQRRAQRDVGRRKRNAERVRRRPSDRNGSRQDDAASIHAVGADASDLEQCLA